MKGLATAIVAAPVAVKALSVAEPEKVLAEPIIRHETFLKEFMDSEIPPQSGYDMQRLINTHQALIEMKARALAMQAYPAIVRYEDGTIEPLKLPDPLPSLDEMILELRKTMDYQMTLKHNAWALRRDMQESV